MNRIPTILILALGLMGCSGTLDTSGRADGFVQPDTGGEMMGDVAVEVVDDAFPDTGTPDTDFDLIDDTEPDVALDTTYDTSIDSPMDTDIDTVIDTIADTGVDTVIDTIVDTGIDTVIDTIVDTGVDTVIDTVVDSPVDTGVDTVIDTIVDTGVDTMVCTPGTTRCSATGNLETCRTDGSGYTTTTCRWGCLGSPAPHCAVWNVSNIGMDIVDDGTGAFNPRDWNAGTDYVAVDTGTGEINACTGSTCWEQRPAGTGLHSGSGIFFQVVTQGGGAPSIGVFAVTEAVIPAGVTVWVTGTNGFALATEGVINIGGILNCKAFFDGSTMAKYPGPGGAQASEGPGAGGDGSEGYGSDDGGGGGAGFGGTGGASGPGSIGGAAGVAYGTSQLVPLLGGSGGGNGADNPGMGGPGGGACELVSLTSITIQSGAGVDAAGHGGDGGGAQGGGGGAGSGGSILLESPIIVINGMLAANGGGGGSGAVSTSTGGQDGERGLLGINRAAGGVSSGTGEAGCNGGAGDSSTDVNGQATVCETGTFDDDDGGGGGGAAGRIRLNATSVTAGANTLSPALSTAACTQGTLPLS